MTAASVLHQRSFEPARRGLIATVTAGVAVIAAASPQPQLAVATVAAGFALAAWHRVLLAPRTLLVVFLATVMLVPARAYRLPVALPFALEPYRVAILLMAVVLLATRIHSGPLLAGRARFGGLLAAVLGTSLLSLAANVSTVPSDGRVEVVNAVLSLLVVGLAFAVVAAAARTSRDRHLVLAMVVGLGAVVALVAVYESLTASNPFNRLGSILPFTFTGTDEPFLRNGELRAVASAQHPLALSAEMAVLLPLAIYLAGRSPWPASARARGLVWGGASVALLGGLFAAGSRTGIVAFAAAAVAAFVLRPDAVRPALWAVVPLTALVMGLSPSSVSSVVEAFTPSKGILAEQHASAGGRGSGRLADLEPTLEAIADRPLFGEGFGTRRTESGQRQSSAPEILDNEYLSRAVDAGVPGVAAFAAAVLAPIGATWRASRRQLGATADLAAALCCAFIAYAVGLLFYDGFAFFQPLLTFLALLAVASGTLGPAVRVRRVVHRASSAEGTTSVPLTDLTDSPTVVPVGPGRPSSQSLARRRSAPWAVPAPAPMPKPWPSLVSVIIPARDAERTIAHQLDALTEQRYAGLWELLVADNGSSDRTVDVVRSFSPRLPLRVVDASHAIGPGSVRNMAAQEARGELLVFCDADDIVAPHWLQQMVAASRSADLVGGRIDEEALNDPSVRRWRSPQQPDHGLAAPAGFLPFGSSANLAVDATLFHTLGGFRTDLATHEDVELCWRAQLEGHAIGFAPDAVVQYRHRTTRRALFKQQYRFGSGSVRLYAIYRHAGMPRDPARVVLGAWRRIFTGFLPALIRREDVLGEHLRLTAMRTGRLVGTIREATLYL